MAMAVAQINRTIFIACYYLLRLLTQELRVALARNYRKEQYFWVRG